MHEKGGRCGQPHTQLTSYIMPQICKDADPGFNLSLYSTVNGCNFL